MVAPRKTSSDISRPAAGDSTGVGVAFIGYATRSLRARCAGRKGRIEFGGVFGNGLVTASGAQSSSSARFWFHVHAELELCAPPAASAVTGYCLRLDSGRIFGS